MYVLGIETSCDETSCAVVKDGSKIYSNVVSSQAQLHAQYGGVVPELACRRHIDLISHTVDEALKIANKSLEQIDLIAVTQGPGLIGALLIGINMAKALALSMNIPFVGVNHIQAHLYASMMNQNIEFPALGLVVSGGHTHLLLIHQLGSYELISQTIDDALGEAFDKVSCMLGLSYPGGPQIEKLAKNGDPDRFAFKAGQIKNSPLDFSFSGLKTAVLYTIQGQNKKEPLVLDEQTKMDIAASFQKAAFSDIVKKTEKACEKFGCKTIVTGGGVIANSTLKKMLTNIDKPIYFPTTELSLDNGAMIGALGYYQYRLCNEDSYDLQPFAKLDW